MLSSFLPLRLIPSLQRSTCVRQEIGMISFAVASLCLCLVAADYDDHHDDHHHKSTLVKEETIGKEYADWKVYLDKDSYKYHVDRKLEQDQGNGKEYSDDYRKVSAKIIPHKGYFVDKHGHKKEHVLYEIPFKAEWGVKQKLPIVQRTPIKHHY
ncbi:unnamed protein product [Cyprideis torosa]|uniref:Uncharacterized protein n=1 Tax=Cyprideis torosa TaxID=163714 RepID=A0A7R8WGN1_9CRUS|nr:unnamed protein product [Cyprideis torosa]CAG0896807.1 unnamed protein product [Cyprideis torosa]